MVSLLTALCLDAESVFEAFVRVGTGDNLGVGAAHVHIALPVDYVAAVALKPVGCRERRHGPEILVSVKRMIMRRWNRWFQQSRVTSVRNNAR